jgi:CRP-like cAMP-binding protein
MPGRRIAVAVAAVAAVAAVTVGVVLLTGRDESTAGQRAVAQSLQRVELFEDLSTEDVDALAATTAVRVFQPGQVIFHQGDPGQALFVVDSGQVRIGLRDPTGKETVLATLGKGEVFGELSIFESGERSADATAVGRTRLLEISHDSFRPYLEERPEVGLALLEVLARRLRLTNADLQACRAARPPT